MCRKKHWTTMRASSNTPTSVCVSTSQACENGADLLLSITNKTERTWPEIAAIIPCFNPGKQPEVSETPAFFDDDHERTWFLAEEGLVPLIHRDIHYNHTFRSAIDTETVWSDKWPTSPTNATGGILMRESTDRTWIAGIAWADFLSVQGHNPWRCMHQSIRAGALAPGETATICGKIYLFDRLAPRLHRKIQIGLYIRAGLKPASTYTFATGNCISVT